LQDISTRRSISSLSGFGPAAGISSERCFRYLMLVSWPHGQRTTPGLWLLCGMPFQGPCGRGSLARLWSVGGAPALDLCILLGNKNRLRVQARTSQTIMRSKNARLLRCGIMQILQDPFARTFAEAFRRIIDLLPFVCDAVLGCSVKRWSGAAVSRAAFFPTAVKSRDRRARRSPDRAGVGWLGMDRAAGARQGLLTFA